MEEDLEPRDAADGGRGTSKHILDIIRLGLYAVFVGGVLILGNCYRIALEEEQARRQHSTEMLRVAVDILREEPASHRRPLRKWAVATMDTFSRRTGVPLGDSARRILLNQSLTPAGPITVPGTRSQNLIIELRTQLQHRGVDLRHVSALLPRFVERFFPTVEGLVSYVADGGQGREPSTYLPPDSAYALVRTLADSLELVPEGLSRREFLDLPTAALSEKQ